MMSNWTDLTDRLNLNQTVVAPYVDDLILHVLPIVGQFEMDNILSVWGQTAGQNDVDIILSDWGKCPTFQLSSISYGQHGSIELPTIDWANGVFTYQPLDRIESDLLHFTCWHMYTRENFHGVVTLIFTNGGG